MSSESVLIHIYNGFVELFQKFGMKAYIQGDWIATQIINASANHNESQLADAKQTYRNKLDILSRAGIQNMATWHDQAVGLHNKNKSKDSDAIRNTSEINKSECVITLAEQLNPEFKHWGSIALMAYAVGQGKRCYIVSHPDNVIRRSHFVYHPLIMHFDTLDDFVVYILNNLVVDVDEPSVTFENTKRKK